MSMDTVIDPIAGGWSDSDQAVHLTDLLRKAGVTKPGLEFVGVKHFRHLFYLLFPFACVGRSFSMFDFRQSRFSDN